MKKIPGIFLFLILILVLICAAVFLWFNFFAPPGNNKKLEYFSLRDDTPAIIAGEQLQEKGFIKNKTTFTFVYGFTDLLAGGYQLSKAMNVLETVKTLKAEPSALWVVVKPGMRKEQIAEKLKEKFNWNQKDIDEFLAEEEGRYFPDTYLISKNESGEVAAKRMQNRFAEIAGEVGPRTLIIASLVQREAGGKEDMPLIAGIIWNRVLRNMLLQIDASNQYVTGKNGNWWPHVTSADLKIPSPYNLYQHKGLPPTPIANPGLDAIQATLNSTQTDCLFYLHDSSKQIHCSVTYQEHLEKIKQFLQ